LNITKSLRTRSTTRHLRSLGSVGAIAGLLMMQAGCAEEAVDGSALGLRSNSQALTSIQLDSVNGTYGDDCINRTGGWSLDLGGGAPFDFPLLSVVLEDTGCALTMTSLHTVDGGIIPADPAIGLTASYQGAPSSFEDPIEFYGNAKLSSVAFASNFVLTVLYSDDPNLGTGSNTSSFSVVQASATAQSVDAPDYLLNVDGIQLLTDADDVVVSQSGSASLSSQLRTGERYVIADLAGLDTYAEMDDAYIAGTDAALITTIPVVNFGMLNDDLTTSQTRSLILAHIEEGVHSYQTFEITFHKAVVNP
jgi:hypothetical protein